MGERGGFKLCNDPIVHRLHRFEGAHHQIASQQFRSLPSPSRTLLTRFKRELTQRTRASIMRLRGPTFLSSTADCGRRSAAPATGSRRTRPPRLRRPPLVTYKISQNRRELRFRAARRARPARVVAAPRRAPERCRCRCGHRAERRAGAGSSSWVDWARGRTWAALRGHAVQRGQPPHPCCCRG